MTYAIVLGTIAAVMTVGCLIVLWSIWYDNRENVKHWTQLIDEWWAERRRR